MDKYKSISENELCVLAKEGDTQAEYALVQKYSSLVKACARPYFLAGGDSEDLIQEGMFGLISAIREFRPDGGASFRAFCELCIRRRLYTAIRSASTRKNISLDDCLSLQSPHFDENQAQAVNALCDAFKRGPEDLIIEKEGSDELLSSFLTCLSKLEAEVLGLYLKGLSYREIASRLNTSEKSVDNAVQRIRRKLASNVTSGDIR